MSKDDEKAGMIRVKQMEFAEWIHQWNLLCSEKERLPFGHGSGSYFIQTFYSVLEFHGTKEIPDKTNPIGAIVYEPGSRPSSYHINPTALVE